MHLGGIPTKNLGLTAVLALQILNKKTQCNIQIVVIPGL